MRCRQAARAALGEAAFADAWSAGAAMPYDEALDDALERANAPSTRPAGTPGP